MALAAGVRLGPYEIHSAIGAGGMGEVWKARDTTLGRDVALKILPDHLALDLDRLARFKREAQILASLNHPNIGAIHGFQEADGVQPSSQGSGEPGRSPQGVVRALVLELVEGPTLADRIAQGPIPIDEALPIARQIAEALEAAHEQGIIHRDLKPANIKLRPDGAVKVLDFGLAKAIDPAVAVVSPDPSVSPTITIAAATHVGVILGTAAYMSPEQARGRPTDRRSDVWAFGCLLFEMLSGTRAFSGEHIADTLAAVLHGQPDWQALPRDTPPALARLLHRCLERDSKQRLRDIGDAPLEIQDLLASPAEPSIASAQPRPLARRVAPLAAAVLVTPAAIAYLTWMFTAPPPPHVQRFNLVLPDGERFTNSGRNLVAISPSGTHVVYSANDRLNLRPFDQLEATPIRGTEQGARMPFFSPDGEWIGFWQSGLLMTVAATGGVPIKICETDNPFGATWSDDNSILYGSGPAGVWRVAADGGVPELVVKVAEGESAHGPQLLPASEWILFTLRPAGATWDDAQLVAQSMRSGERRVIHQGGRDGRYLATGHLLYANDQTVLAMVFDLSRLQTRGSAIPILEGVPNAGVLGGASQFAVAGNGTLVYVARLSAATGIPVWVDRAGREESALTPVPLQGVRHPRISPDGRRLAIIVEGDVWVYDLEGRPPIRLTREGALYSPIWTHDGQRVIYESGTPQGLFSIPADGSGAASTASPVGHYHAIAMAADGRGLFVTDIDNQTAGTNTDVSRIVPGEEPSVQPLVATPFREGFEGASLSPDGRWLVYASDTTGQLEIWVRPLAAPGAPVRVSPNGGIEPVWARSGREFFYLEGRRLMMVPVTPSATFDFKPPTFLFEARYALEGQPPSYDLGPDGRFLMISSPATSC